MTHGHSDHFDTGKINKLYKKDTTVIAPKQLASIVWKVITLKPREETETKDIKAKAVEAYNIKRFKSPGKPWHPKGYGGVPCDIRRQNDLSSRRHGLHT